MCVNNVCVYNVCVYNANTTALLFMCGEMCSVFRNDI